MSGDLILVLDEGTTSTRAIVYAPDGAILHVAQQALTQYYPEPGHVEHDAAEIWAKTLACARQAIARAGGAARIAALGTARLAGVGAGLYASLDDAMAMRRTITRFTPEMDETARAGRIALWRRSTPRELARSLRAMVCPPP